jgi:hypothetical protein
VPQVRRDREAFRDRLPHRRLDELHHGPPAVDDWFRQ